MIEERRKWVRDGLVAQGGSFSESSLDWYDGACAEIAAGVSDARFGSLISLASRKVQKRPAELSEDALRAAQAILPGWNPFNWNTLELARVGLILARTDLDQPSSTQAILGALEFADVGELCAIYHAMPLLPRAEDYVWQAGEGCRSNMSAVFQAIACDNPFPAKHFDDVAWRSLAIKALFSGAPLWRVQGLDGRMGEELAKVALDLADERRSAQRPVQPELWLCLGTFGGERAAQSMQLEVQQGQPNNRAAAAFGLARAGHLELLRELRSLEKDRTVQAAMDRALAGQHSQVEFRTLHCQPH